MKHEVSKAEYISTLAPAGGATSQGGHRGTRRKYFYSRPCGRGDHEVLGGGGLERISTLAPAGGATASWALEFLGTSLFLLSPLREGRLLRCTGLPLAQDFYSRPCGRGDAKEPKRQEVPRISTLAPAGGATKKIDTKRKKHLFLLSPLREGRLADYGILVIGIEQFLLSPLREGRHNS